MHSTSTDISHISSTTHSPSSSQPSNQSDPSSDGNGDAEEANQVDDSVTSYSVTIPQLTEDSSVSIEAVPSTSRGLSTSVHAPPSPTPPTLATPPPSTTPLPTPAPTPTTQPSPNQPQDSQHPTPTTTKTTLQTPVSTPVSSATPLKTPNVYINGLPPHFPEDELFALTAPYGGVRSVRSFTRHVGERSSGYGFVLFDTVESAERCIEGLKRYRNLHPSFSKQIHKIPGTVYAHTNRAASASSTHESGSDSAPEGNCHSSGGGKGVSQEDSFKTRMEKLHDESSTNLYIEGLPLSIDDATLAALVSPYAIKSSRFFQTKLSHPPRIIAFVRLETRMAAEEIIERLHGRMVRGWNDPGSRISVRFADTNEQRELRRAERSTREGDHSPARLTIAQAALLNLRGQEIQAHPSVSSLAPQHHHLPSAGATEFHSVSPRAGPAFEYDALGRQYATEYPTQVNTHTLIGVDYNHPPTAQDEYLHHYQTVNRDARLPGGYPHLPFTQPQPRQDVTPEMAILLDSLRKSGVPYRGGSHAGTFVDYDPALRSRGQPISLPGSSIDLYPGTHIPVIGQAQAHNGFTPAEELILQAHARARGDFGVDGGGGQGQQHQLGRGPRHANVPGANVNISMGVRGHRTVASTLSLPPPTLQGYPSPVSPIDLLPSVPTSEAGFHSNAIAYHRPSFDNEDLAVDGGKNLGLRVNNNVHSPHIINSHQPSRDFDSISMQQQHEHEQQASVTSYPNIRTRTKVQNLKQNPHQMHAPHIRSTTLPHRSSTSQTGNQHQRHFQHSSLSMTIPNSSNSNRTDHIQSPKLNQNQNQASLNNYENASIFDHDNSNNFNINHPTAGNGGNLHHYRNDAERIGSNDIINNAILPSRDYETAHFTHPLKHDDEHAYNSHISNNHNDTNVDRSAVPSASPPLVSPALTYSSSSRTPATLSPSTPFFNSFGSSMECFEGLGHGPGIEANLKKMTLGN